MNEPAFPAMHYDLADNEHGLTMRDYFAAKAMQALLNQPEHVAQAFKTLGLKENEVADHISAGAYHFADAMLKERSRETA